jgi:hypothetical protein
MLHVVAQSTHFNGENIIQSHLWDGQAKQTYGEELIMWILLQMGLSRATAQMALLQFMHAGKQLLFHNSTL